MGLAWGHKISALVNFTYSPVNRFRTQRGRRLRRQIEALADHLGRKIVVLDIGGRADYWANVGLARIARIELVNYSADELERDFGGVGARRSSFASWATRAVSRTMPMARWISSIPTRSSSMSAAGRT